MYGVGIVATIGIEVGVLYIATIPEFIQPESVELLKELESNGMSYK